MLAGHLRRRERYLVDGRRVDKPKIAPAHAILTHCSRKNRGESDKGAIDSRDIMASKAAATLRSARSIRGTGRPAMGSLKSSWKRTISASGTAGSEVNHSARLGRHRSRAEPRHFDEAGDGGRRTADQTPRVIGDKKLVVTDQPRKQSTLAAMIDERQASDRLARARRSRDKDAMLADQDRGPMNVFSPCDWIRHSRSSGSCFGRQRHDEARTVDLAGLGAWNVFGRQRTAMGLDDLRLIDRPRPEFWPNASPAGRSVKRSKMRSILSARIPGPLSSTVTMLTLPARASDMVMWPWSSGTKERAFSIRLVMTWPIRRSWPTTK
jgi:hypothetical protein